MLRRTGDKEGNVIGTKYTNTGKNNKAWADFVNYLKYRVNQIMNPVNN